MSQYLTYVVAQGDTIETISQSQLKINVSRAIISLNTLRYPFISDDPIDQYSSEKGKLQIISTISSSSVTLGNIQSLKVIPLDTLFLRDFTTGYYESVIIKKSTINLDGTITLELQTPLQKSYTRSAIASVFVNQQTVTTKVLKTGDTIYLPATIGNIVSANLAVSNIYGTDIYLDKDGFLERVNGDLKTISDIENVVQAVTMRWRTPMGQLPGDNTYGNRVFEVIGESNQPYYQTLALSFARQSALSDPRVADIIMPNFISKLDAVELSGELKVINSNKNMSISANIPTGGTS